MSLDRVVIRKSWRSEVVYLALMAIFAVAAQKLSLLVPSIGYRLTLFSYDDSSFGFIISPFWLLPLAVLFKILIARYDVRYVMDEKGIEARVGIMSVTQRVNKVRYEDIRSVNSVQSVLGRILDYGRVEVSTPATEEVEIIMEGVAHPGAIKEAVLNEQNVKEKATGEEATVSAARA